MQRQTFVLVLLVILFAGLFFMHMLNVNKYGKVKTMFGDSSDYNPQTSHPNPIRIRGHPFVGEKRFPVVRKPADPAKGGQFQTGVYIKFDTSKYTDMDGHIFIPSDSIIKNFTFEEVKELYYRYIENIQIICPRMRHIGNDEDGGYHVCEPWMPNECLAYSFGSRQEYSFDDGLAAHYNCEVHTFDPADPQPNHQHGELVEFHKIGIGGKDHVNGGMTIKTLGSIREMLKHTERPLDLLKIDTEGAEWNSLVEILHSGTLKKAKVKLLIVEFHTRFTAQDLAAHLLGLQVLKGIYDAGFRIYYTHIWTLGCLITDPKTKLQRAFCHEVHFLRI